jgi:hypothetical protein
MSAPIPGTLSAVIRHGKTRYRLRALDVNDEESGEVSRDGPSVPCWVLQGTLALTKLGLGTWRGESSPPRRFSIIDHSLEAKRWSIKYIEVAFPVF